MAEYIDRTKAYDAVDARIDELRSDKEFNIVKEICISGVNKHIAAIPAADVIPIPEGATNGDIIRTLFPNCEQKEPMYNGYFEKYFDDDLENASYMRVSKDFWDAKYKNEVKE